MPRIRFPFCVVFLAAVHAPVLAQPLQSVRIAQGLTNPVFATTAPTDPSLMYVVQQNGTVRTLNTATNTLNPTPFFNITSDTQSGFISGGERGLLGMAFHPDFANNGFVYFNHTTTGGAARVVRYTVAGGGINPDTRQTVLDIPHPDAANHNAGWIGFNPVNGTTGGNSGHLYVATGDGGGANDPQNNSQNTGNLLGKMLRLDINGTAVGGTYSIPTGNMSGAGVRQEIYAYGLRNPFRNGFDRQTGDLYIGDVGQNNREEIDFIPNAAAGGRNFGWRVREGFIQNPAFPGAPVPPGALDPIHDYDHSFGVSVTGGLVYRGPNAELSGTYFFGDFASSRIWTFEYNGTTLTGFLERTGELEVGQTGGALNSISSFAEDGFGSLYVLDYGGEVYRIVPVPEPAGVLAVVAVAAGGWAARRRRRGLPAGPAVRTVPANAP